MPQVLVLDDDDDVREAIEELVEASSGRPCLGLKSVVELSAKRHLVMPCELAILDINLGADQPTGLDAYAWLRAEGFTGRVVFLTGHAFDHPLVRRACDAGSARVMRKPIEVAELRELVATVRNETASA